MKTRKEVWVNGLVEQSSRIRVNNPLKGLFDAVKRPQKQVREPAFVPVTIVWTTIASLFLIGILNYYVLTKIHSREPSPPVQVPKSDMYQLMRQYELD